MKSRHFFIALYFMAILSCKQSDTMTFDPITVSYPETKKDSIQDDYHGTIIADPYRWLEDDNAEDTKAWVKAQNDVTFGYLNKIPFRKNIEDRLAKLWDYEKYSTPFKEGDKYYYFKNDGLQNQNVMYVTYDPKEDGKVLLDPNKFSEDGTSSLGGLDFSKNGDYLAYFVSEGGSDWRKGYIMDLKTEKNLDEELQWIKFSAISWMDNGFFYSRYPEPSDGGELSKKNEYHSLYYHEIGTPQSADKLIFVDKEHPQRNVYGATTEDENYIILSLSESTSGNSVRVIEKGKLGNIIPIVNEFKDDFNLINNEGSKVWFVTNRDAPKQKLIAVDINNPASTNWQTIIPESDDPLTDVTVAGNKIFASYNHNASSLVKVYDMNGKFLQELELPGIGSIGGISGKKESNEAFYSFTSFTRPSTIYKLNTDDLSSTEFRASTLDFDADQYETKQEWYTSKDGTKVPMFITHKKGLALDGTNPTLLYGYGGFNISLTPSFSISRLPLLEQGGVYVVANIRGGGEFGKEWHESGTKERKQNVFDDFIAAAEHLISQKYTSSDKLALQGGSNGGLLVGACMTQRPDLFAVALPAVGVLDMLRYHNFTIGWAWATDYGRSDDEEAFPYLIKYSPLHNVKEVAYPATMVTTADHDDRVVPAHSFKFAAELQDKHKGDTPVLIRIETSAGHGAGKPTSKQIEEAADILSFMFYNTNTPYKM